MRVHCSELDSLVRKIDEDGGIEKIGPTVQDFQLVYDTKVDQALDPFSETYAEQQIALYREISGREVDQKNNEMCAFHFDSHVAASNPYGLRDVSHMARHTATLSNAFIQAKLRPNPNVLDMGSGWGLSTELLCFLGARVTAVDINPQFVDLLRVRSMRLGYPVEAVLSSFDEFETDSIFDMVLFYECLHHAIRPWKTVEQVSSKLGKDGVIVLAGEPIQEIWWQNWGMRLDLISVYCVRKFGWFESGFSKPFVTRMMERIGFQTEFNEGSALSGEPICISRRSSVSSDGSVIRS